MPKPVIDYSPAPGAATWTHRMWSHGRTEATLLLRNGEQLLLALVIPLVILIGGRFAGGSLGFAKLDVLAPSVLTLAIWSSAFTSLAISTGFERRYGVTERLASTPLGRAGLVAGKAVSLVLVLAGQLAVLATVAVILGWRPAGGPLPTLAAGCGVLLAIVAFASWALVIAGTLRAEVTLGLANLIYLAFVVAGAVVLPLASYPAALRLVVACLPTAALGELLRNWSTNVGNPLPLVVLTVWAAVGLLIARKVFRWTS